MGLTIDHSPTCAHTRWSADLMALAEARSVLERRKKFRAARVVGRTIRTMRSAGAPSCLCSWHFEADR